MKIKNLIFAFIGAIVINGCEVLAIPTLVTKDVSLGVILVNDLEDKDKFAQNLFLDLSSLVSQDELDGIKEIYLTEVTFTLINYENSITKDKVLKGNSAVLIVRSLVNSTGDVNNNILGLGGPITVDIPKKANVDKVQNVKDLIRDGKVAFGIFLKTDSPSETFNDNSFAFSVSIKTEVLLE